MSGKEIYFHCGLPKTGTSAIQQYLTIKSEDGEGNFLYPETGLGPRPHKSAHHDLVRPGFWYRMGLGGGNYEISDADMLHEVLLSEIFSSDVKKVIISSELFGCPGPFVETNLHTFIESVRSDGDEVRCVIYLRNFVEWAKSLHLQLCRARHLEPKSVTSLWPPETGTDFEKWLTTGLHETSASAQIPHLASIFNQKSTIIRYYEGDVVEDFCKVVGIEFDGRRIIANKSIGESEAMRDSLLTDNARKIMRERHYEPESKFADEFLTKEQKNKYLEGILYG